MSSDNDSNDAPVHRRRTQGTRPLPSSSTTTTTTGQQQTSINRSFHLKKENTYSDDYEPEEDEDEEIDEDDDDEQHQTTYRGRGRPSQQQQQHHLIDNSYDDNDHHDYPRYTGPLREQDRYLPIANIAKIMKKSVPEKGKIAKDAKETIQECISEFISFITSEASDRCLQEKRKTINGEDIILAMLSLGFDSYVEPLRTFLSKIRDASKYDRNMNIGDEINEDLQINLSQTQTQTQNNNQTLTTNPNPSGNNTSGLEPYGHSVRVVTCVRNDQAGDNGNYVYTIQPYQ